MKAALSDYSLSSKTCKRKNNFMWVFSSIESSWTNGLACHRRQERKRSRRRCTSSSVPLPHPVMWSCDLTNGLQRDLVSFFICGSLFISPFLFFVCNRFWNKQRRWSIKECKEKELKKENDDYSENEQQEKRRMQQI